MEHFWWTNTPADPVGSLEPGCDDGLQGAGLRHGCAGEPSKSSSRTPEPCGGTPALMEPQCLALGLETEYDGRP